MATCPRCLGPLTDDHRCPRERSSRILHAVAWAAVGGASGLVAMALIDPAQRETHLDIWVISGTALLGALLYRMFGDRP